MVRRPARSLRDQPLGIERDLTDRLLYGALHFKPCRRACRLKIRLPKHSLGLATVAQRCCTAAASSVSVCIVSAAAKRLRNLDVCLLNDALLGDNGLTRPSASAFFDMAFTAFRPAVGSTSDSGTRRDRVCRNIEMRRTICFGLPHSEIQNYFLFTMLALFIAEALLQKWLIVMG